MDKDIERVVQHCNQCQQVKATPPAAPLQPWQWLSRPWARIHIDFAGPIEGKMMLIAIDAHSKWIEAKLMSTTTATVTIEQLRCMFAQHGIPETVVSDNGPRAVHVRRVYSILPQKWHTPCASNTIPSIVKWARGESRTDHKEWYTEDG